MADRIPSHRINASEAILRGCLTDVNMRDKLQSWESRMGRSRHPDKHIESAIRYAESLNWRVEMSGGHAWGRLYCPHATRDGCIVSVWSTPQNPENHVRHIRRHVDLCHHPQVEQRTPAEGR